MQYDYLLAYFDFFTGSQDSFKVARKIVKKYQEHPSEKWRVKFLAILDQLNEYDGEFDAMAEDLGKLSGSMSVSSIDIQLIDESKNKKKKHEAALSSVTMNGRTGTLSIESINATSC